MTADILVADQFVVQEHLHRLACIGLVRDKHLFPYPCKVFLQSKAHSSGDHGLTIGQGTKYPAV